MKTFTLYGLNKPGEEARYIGITGCDLGERLRKHLIEPEDSHKNRWFKKLLREENIRPEIIPYCVGLSSEEEAKSLERAVIRCLREAGFNLVNGTDGGDGVTMTPEIRAKIGASKKGKKFPKLSAALTGRKLSPEACAKISVALTGRKAPSVALSNSKRVVSDTTKGKMSDAQTLAWGRSTNPQSRVEAARQGKLASGEARFQKVLQLISEGRTQAEIGKIFGVTQQTISDSLRVRKTR